MLRSGTLTIKLYDNKIIKNTTTKVIACYTKSTKKDE